MTKDPPMIHSLRIAYKLTEPPDPDPITRRLKNRNKRGLKSPFKPIKASKRKKKVNLCKRSKSCLSSSGIRKAQFLYLQYIYKKIFNINK